MLRTDFTAYLPEFAVGAVLLALGIGFGWYLMDSMRRVQRPFMLRHPEVASAAVVIELGLMLLGLALVADAVLTWLLATPV